MARLPRGGPRLRAMAVALTALTIGVAARSGSRPPSRDVLEPIVANTNRNPAGRLRHGSLSLQLELRRGRFRPQADDGPETVMQAFGQRGGPLQIPGPLIRVPAGTVIEATVRNTLSDSTLVLHGLGGRPGPADDTVQVRPGTVRRVRFSVDVPGTYYYWGSTGGRGITDFRWSDSQLSGALIVDPAGDAPNPAERVFVIGVAKDSTREFMTINGKSWPNTERLDYAVGDTVRWRWINASASSHPMHLHGFFYDVDSRGSWAADTVYGPADRRLVVTELMPPAGTMTVHWVPTRPGNWVFHCHFAFHISRFLFMAPADDSSAGHGGVIHSMAGLVLGLRVHRPDGDSASAQEPGEARRLRLLVQRAPAGADSAHLMGYVLQQDEQVPAFDSVQVPGPAIVLERGRPVRITVVNRLDQPTAVHWHGVELESYADGVPNLSGTAGRLFHAIAPSDSFTAAFTPPRSGTFMYHAHADETVQILGGLYGPLIVVDPGTTLDTASNRIVMIGILARHDSLFGVVNGRVTPDPIDLTAGRTYRLRIANIGDARVWASLRRADSASVPWRQVAKDGADLPPAQLRLTRAPLLTGPGEIADYEVSVASPDTLALVLDARRAPWKVEVPVWVH